MSLLLATRLPTRGTPSWVKTMALARGTMSKQVSALELRVRMPGWAEADEDEHPLMSSHCIWQAQGQWERSGRGSTGLAMSKIKRRCWGTIAWEGERVQVVEGLATIELRRGCLCERHFRLMWQLLPGLCSCWHSSCCCCRWELVQGFRFAFNWSLQRASNAGECRSNGMKQIKYEMKKKNIYKFMAEELKRRNKIVLYYSKVILYKDWTHSIS